MRYYSEAFSIAPNTHRVFEEACSFWPPLCKWPSSGSERARNLPMVTQSLCRSCRDEPGPSFSKWDHLFHPAFVDGTSDHLG